MYTDLQNMVYLTKKNLNACLLKILLSRTQSLDQKTFFKRYNYIHNLQGTHKVFATSMLNILYINYVMSVSSFS